MDIEYAIKLTKIDKVLKREASRCDEIRSDIISNDYLCIPIYKMLSYTKHVNRFINLCDDMLELVDDMADTTDDEEILDTIINGKGLIIHVKDIVMHLFLSDMEKILN